MLLQKWLSHRTLLAVLFLLTNSVHATDNTTIHLKSADGLLITADSYLPHDTNTAPLIVLFHQAGSSRGEYSEIAPRLNELGFNCIAVDQRSGEYSRGDHFNYFRRSRADKRQGVW